tara:strand:- start:1295 stop:1477 length:183 start_codon:yes stop_codon:yes gene_type:complete
MKTEQQVFDMLDGFMETDPKTTEIDAIILALDWVLDRVDTKTMDIQAADMEWKAFGRYRD